MDAEEVKKRLAGYRPELYADDDPLVAEALVAVASDPGLQAWLAAEVAFDREMTSQLQNATPPAGAKEALLTAVGSVTADEGSRGGTKRQRRARGRITGRRRRWLLYSAAAAVAVVALVLGRLFVFPPPVEFPVAEYDSAETFRDHMAYFATQRFVLDELTDKLDEAGEWLSSRGYPVYGAVPGRIAEFESMGCKTIDWGGHRVGLVCFVDNSGEIVHLFVIDASALTGTPTDGEALAAVDVRHGLETGGWQEGGQVYLLVGSEPDVPVGHLLL